MTITHYKKQAKGGLFLVALFSISLLGGCLDSSTTSDAEDELAGEAVQIVIPESGINFDIASVNYAGITVDSSVADLLPGARLLAAQCAQCHGTYGVAVSDWPDLWGGGPEDRQIGNAMVTYQDETLYSNNMMYLHALAYTPEEVDLLKSYYPKIVYDENAVEGE